MKSKMRITGNRTVIGIICIVLALGITFGIAPLVNRFTDRKVEVVQVKQNVERGHLITEDDVELVKQGRCGIQVGKQLCLIGRGKQCDRDRLCCVGFPVAVHRIPGRSRNDLYIPEFGRHMGLIRLLVIDNDADYITVLELIGQPLRKGRDIDRDGDLGSVESGQHILAFFSCVPRG